MASTEFYSRGSKSTGSDAQVNTFDIEPNTAGHIGTTVPQKWQGTDNDRSDMRILGRIQELRRNFQFLPILGLACTLVATWEVVITTLSTSLNDGGTAGLLWGFLIVFCGFLFVYLSLAEMASMSPTSGGQYHWVSEFAPRSCQRFLSYMVGWLCFTGWQAAITSITYLAGTVIQGLIILNKPDYVFHSWHGTLLVIAITLFAIVFNTLLARELPLAEGILLILHVLGMFAILITLWVLAPTASAHDVWLEFLNSGGWNSLGTSTMVGLLSPVISMLGFDCVTHMGEEIKDASYTLPRAMIWSFIFNAALGFVMAVTIVFTLGSVDDILATDTLFPFIQVLLNVTKSHAAASILTVIVVITLIASAIAEVATVSRQLWSFARDRGVPGHRFLSKITWSIPLNAVLVSLLVTVLLSLINIGSTAALNAILALAAVSLLTSYIIVIGCLLHRRLFGEPLPPSRFCLGHYGGILINILALCYLAPIFVFSFFPATASVTPVTMNWAIVIYSGVMVFALIYYVLVGRRQYTGPVVLMKRHI